MSYSPRFSADCNGAWLLSEVLTSVRADGRLSRTYTLDDLMRQLQAWKEHSSTYVVELHALHERLVGVAEAGDLEEIHEHVCTHMYAHELTPAFTQRLFVAALQAGQLHICEYMRRSGLPLRFVAEHEEAMAERPVFGTRLLLQLIDAVAEAALAQEEDISSLQPVDARALRSLSAARTASSEPELSAHARAEPRVHWDTDELTLPVPPAVATQYLVEVCRCPVNTCDRPDGYTPLHVAALLGVPAVVHTLLRAGADANAVAQDECTPLGCALLGRRDHEWSQPARERYDECLALLMAAGGAEHWRDAIRRPPPAVAAATVSEKTAVVSIPSRAADPSPKPTFAAATSASVRVCVSLSEPAVHAEAGHP